LSTPFASLSEIAMQMLWQCLRGILDKTTIQLARQMVLAPQQQQQNQMWMPQL